MSNTKTSVNGKAIAWICLAGPLLAGASEVAAVEKTWVGSMGGNWALSTNWNPGGEPTSTDSAAFVGSANALVTLLGGKTIAGITISNSGTTEIGSNAATSRQLTFNNVGLTMNTGAGAVTFGKSYPRINGDQEWRNDSENTLTFSSIVNAVNSPNLTMTGSGNILASGRVGHPTAGQRVNALIKSGQGTLTTGDVYSETGITVQAGTYLLNGTQFDVDLDRASVVSVSAGATLGGNGTFKGPSSVSGNLQPGSNGVGMMTFEDSLELLGTAVTTMEIAGVTERGGSYDAIDVVLREGGLTFGGGLELAFTEVAEEVTYNLFNFTGASSGGFSSVTLAGLYNGSLVEANGIWSGSDGGLSFTFSELSGDLTVIPEPGTYALLFGLSVLAIVVVRRRKQAIAA